MKDFIIITIDKSEIVNKKPLRTFFEKLADGRYKIEISPYNRRTLPQNRYYWGIVVALVQDGIKHLGTELTKDETHEFLKSRFNFEEIVNTETSEVINIPRSTAGLTKQQFSEYIEKIQRFAAEFLNVVIPDAGTQQEIGY